MLASVGRLYHYSSPMWQMLRAKISNARIPIRLDLNVTKLCNLRCRYCYVDFEALKRKPEITTEQWKQVLSDMHRRGTRAVRIMGGEPLMRDDIGEIIGHAKRLGMVTEINTNGYFVKKRIDALKLVDSICISLDGDPEANDQLRGKGCHARVIEAIEIAKQNGLPVRLHGMMTNATLDSLDYLADLASRFGISFTCAPCCLPDLKENHPDLHVDQDRTIAFYRRYLELKGKHHAIPNSRRAIEHVINWPFGDKFVHCAGEDWPKGVRSYVRCQYGHRSCYIDADGAVYACSTQWGLGLNYFEHGFDACWEYLESNLKCVTCNTVNDFSYAFALHPATAFEVVREVIRGG